MNELHTKSFRAAYDYWFENKPLEEVVQTLKPEEIKEETKIIAESKEEVKTEQVNEGFETHVLCNECGSGNLELSVKKTKLRCNDCGNVGLTESIVGLK